MKEHPTVTTTRIVSTARDISRQRRTTWDDIANPGAYAAPLWDEPRGADHAADDLDSAPTDDRQFA